MKITIAPGVDTTPDEVRDSHVFQQWLYRKHRYGIKVRGVRINGIYRSATPNVLRVMQATMEAYDGTGRQLDRLALICGKTVDIIAIVRVAGEEGMYIVHVQQPRGAAMQACVTSNPSGMVDEDENVQVGGLRELAEELDEPDLAWTNVVDIGKAYTDSPEPILVSPGRSDETCEFLAAHITLTHEQLERLNNKFGGAADEGERTQVLVTPFPEAVDALRIGGAVDLKALTSLLLYKEYLASQA